MKINKSNVTINVNVNASLEQDKPVESKSKVWTILDILSKVSLIVKAALTFFV